MIAYFGLDLSGSGLKPVAISWKKKLAFVLHKEGEMFSVFSGF
jgi:hypothetical protein